MVYQLFIGGVLVTLTVIIQAVFISTLMSWVKKYDAWFVKEPFFRKNILILVFVVLWLMLGIIMSTWLWAIAFIVLDIFQTLEPALYFSMTIFTTLGFGDMLLDEKWRLLTGIGATNGLIILGLTTAFIAEFISRVRTLQSQVIDNDNPGI